MSKTMMPRPEEALPGRSDKMPIPKHHAVNQTLLDAVPAGMKQALFGMGCFWGAEKAFWKLPGVYSTAVGYAGGTTVDPNYRQVCSGNTGHAEVVLVIYDPEKINYEDLLRVFWESHDPTQGMRQGNDVGTQYRSAIYTFDAKQNTAAEQSRKLYQKALRDAGRGGITTEIRGAPPFFYAEDYHQQYLAKNPVGYCGLGGCGVAFKSAGLQVGEKA